MLSTKTSQLREHFLEQHLNELRAVGRTPVLGEFSNALVCRGKHNAVVFHTLKGDFVGKLAGRAARVGDDLHGVAFLHGADGRLYGANIVRHARHDEVLAARRFRGGGKGRVFPTVHDASAFDACGELFRQDFLKLR